MATSSINLTNPKEEASVGIGSIEAFAKIVENIIDPESKTSMEVAEDKSAEMPDNKAEVQQDITKNEYNEASVQHVMEYEASVTVKHIMKNQDINVSVKHADEASVQQVLKNEYNEDLAKYEMEDGENESSVQQVIEDSIASVQVNEDNESSVQQVIEDEDNESSVQQVIEDDDNEASVQQVIEDEDNEASVIEDNKASVQQVIENEDKEASVQQVIEDNNTSIIQQVMKDEDNEASVHQVIEDEDNEDSVQQVMEDQDNEDSVQHIIENEDNEASVHQVIEHKDIAASVQQVMEDEDNKNSMKTVEYGVNSLSDIEYSSDENKTLSDNSSLEKIEMDKEDITECVEDDYIEVTNTREGVVLEEETNQALEEKHADASTARNVYEPEKISDCKKVKYEKEEKKVKDILAKAMEEISDKRIKEILEKTIEEIPEEVINEKPEDTIDENPEEIIDEKTEERVNEKLEETINAKPEETIVEKLDETINDMPKKAIIDEKLEETINTKPGDTINEKPEDTIDENAEKIIDEKTEERLNEKLEETINAKPEETIVEKLDETIGDMPKKAINEIPENAEKASMEMIGSELKEIVNDVIEEIPGSLINEIPEQITQVITKGEEKEKIFEKEIEKTLEKEILEIADKIKETQEILEQPEEVGKLFENQTEVEEILKKDVMEIHKETMEDPSGQQSKSKVQKAPELILANFQLEISNVIQNSIVEQTTKLVVEENPILDEVRIEHQQDEISAIKEKETVSTENDEEILTLPTINNNDTKADEETPEVRQVNEIETGDQEKNIKEIIETTENSEQEQVNQNKINTKTEIIEIEDPIKNIIEMPKQLKEEQNEITANNEIFELKDSAEETFSEIVDEVCHNKIENSLKEKLEALNVSISTARNAYEPENPDKDTIQEPKEKEIEENSNDIIKDQNEFVETAMTEEREVVENYIEIPFIDSEVKIQEEVVEIKCPLVVEEEFVEEFDVQTNQELKEEKSHEGGKEIDSKVLELDSKPSAQTEIMAKELIEDGEWRKLMKKTDGELMEKTDKSLMIPKDEKSQNGVLVIEEGEILVTNGINNQVEENKIEVEEPSTNTEEVTCLSDMEYSSDENVKDVEDHLSEKDDSLIEEVKTAEDFNNEDRDACIIEPFEIITEVERENNSSSLTKSKEEVTKVSNNYEERIKTKSDSSEDYDTCNEEAAKLTSASTSGGYDTCNEEIKEESERLESKLLMDISIAEDYDTCDEEVTDLMGKEVEPSKEGVDEDEVAEVHIVAVTSEVANDNQKDTEESSPNLTPENKASETGDEENDIVAAEDIPKNAITATMDEILNEIEDKKNVEEADGTEVFHKKTEEELEMKVQNHDPKLFVPHQSNPPKRSVLVRILQILLGCFNCFQGHAS